MLVGRRVAFVAMQDNSGLERLVGLEVITSRSSKLIGFVSLS